MDDYTQITNKQYKSFIIETHRDATKKLYAYLLGIQGKDSRVANSFYYEEGDWFDIVLWKFLLDSGFEYSNIGTIMFATLIRGLIESVTVDKIPGEPMDKFDTISEKEQVKKFIEEKFGYKIGCTLVTWEENTEAFSVLIPQIFAEKAQEAQKNHLDNSGGNYKFRSKDGFSTKVCFFSVPEIVKNIQNSYQSSFYSLDADFTNFAQVLADIIEKLAYGRSASSPYNNPRSAKITRQSMVLAREHYRNRH